MTYLLLIRCIFCGFPFPASLGDYGCQDCGKDDELGDELAQLAPVDAAACCE